LEQLLTEAIILEHRWFFEVGKDKEMDSLLGLPEGIQTC
jgi:hypothetical protein